MGLTPLCGQGVKSCRSVLPQICPATSRRCANTTSAWPRTEDILRTAKKLGVGFYRLGFIDRQSDVARQISEIKAQLKDLAAMNKQIGIGGLLQNHSPSGHTF